VASRGGGCHDPGVPVAPRLPADSTRRALIADMLPRPEDAKEVWQNIGTFRACGPIRLASAASATSRGGVLVLIWGSIVMAVTGFASGFEPRPCGSCRCGMLDLATMCIITRAWLATWPSSSGISTCDIQSGRLSDELDVVSGRFPWHVAPASIRREYERLCENRRRRIRYRPSVCGDTRRRAARQRGARRHPGSAGHRSRARLSTNLATCHSPKWWRPELR